MLVTKENIVKLGDFGFIQSAYDAELLQEGTTLGTPDYISPEQARGERDLDVRSDIYSLGASVFHMLTGRTLFKGSCSQVMRDHINTEAPPIDSLRSDVSTEFRRVLARMLAKDPADRYQSAEEVISDLEMLKIDQAADSGDLPATRSQILHVISAEKARIAVLEKQAAAANRKLLMVALIALAGWAWSVYLQVCVNQ